MYSLLLSIIYIAFISLGLPDSLLGSAWPVMYGELSVPISYAGIVTMIIAGGTVLSSLMSDKMTRRLGAGPLTAISVMMTAIALFGFSVSDSFILLCLWAIPYGIGAGAVDAALNNYVALHYASRHMSWLHCFWGVGAAASPYIMGYSLTAGYGWNNGYRIVAIIQIVLTAILFISLPLWKRKIDTKEDAPGQAKVLSLREVLKIRGVGLILITFLSYCALEATAGLWATTYLVEHLSFDTEVAAIFASFFYLGITFGRFVSGFISDKLGDKLLIRYGLIVILLGICLVGLPIGSGNVSLIGLIIIGLGCAPIYPSVIHATPSNFGSENSQAIIGVQMASAYIGTTLMPPLFGFLANTITIGIYPFYLLIFAVLMIIMSEKLNIKVKEEI